MISQKACSILLGYEVYKDIDFAWNGKDLTIWDKPLERLQKINIYELAHMCKEDAWKKGYSISSVPTKTHWSSTIGMEIFMAETEPEAIIKAYEWLVNKEN